MATPIDLDNCAREPIHIPGSIQPRGVLAAVRELAFQVRQVSANVDELPGRPVDAVLGQHLSTLIGHQQAARVEQAASKFRQPARAQPARMRDRRRWPAAGVRRHPRADRALAADRHPRRDVRPSEFTVEPGHGLVMYSDGLVERRGEVIDEGLGRLAAALGRAGDTPASRIWTAMDSGNIDDDVTVVALWRP
ncbi:SpoIIE family protein phosphatase [Mycobacterium sp. Aquia_216]|uniref:SpoIIE family protein phosphatase n=1 Tax=Mycobacterium sp. Aquia_216 TaxID=2991729 RepID=UPI00227A110F|nr:SpoIIE family protein phosphatase [Mycobacterium sp. Aquia_216]WAJ42497.1 SpoIIE family protein phosphatase [Mycobacterium sp. Aquia_216]